MTAGLLPSRERIATTTPLRARETTRIHRGPCGGWHHDDPRHPRAHACRACLALGHLPRKDPLRMTQITVASHHLRWLLTSVAKHAARQERDPLPQLEHVLLEVEPDRLRASATNRFTLVTATIPATVAGPPATTLLHREHAERTAHDLEELDASTHTNIPIEVTPGQVAVGVLTDRHTYGVDSELIPKFPDLRALIAAALKEPQARVGSVGLSSDLLALWAPVSQGLFDEPLVVTMPDSDPTKAVLLRYGDPDAYGCCLLGLQMPKRWHSGGMPEPAQLHEFAAWAAKPGAAASPESVTTATQETPA